MKGDSIEIVPDPTTPIRRFGPATLVVTVPRKAKGWFT